MRVDMHHLTYAQATADVFSQQKIFVKPLCGGDNDIYDGEVLVARVHVDERNNIVTVTDRDKSYTYKHIKKTGMEDPLNRFVNSLVFYKKDEDRDDIAAIHLFLTYMADNYTIKD